MSDINAVIYALASLLSVVAAALAWTARLWWGREFAAAKDETIKAKDAQISALRDQFQETIRTKDIQIEMLREFTPMKLREYFLSTQAQMEEYVDHLKGELQSAQETIASLSGRVDKEILVDAIQVSNVRMVEIVKQFQRKMAEVDKENAQKVKDLGLILLESMPISPSQKKKN